MTTTTTTPVLPLTFQLLAICGCWRPASCTSPCRKAMYDVFSVFAVFLVYSLTLSEIISIFSADNVDDLIEKSYMLLTSVAASCKMASLLIYRRNIVALIDSLAEDPYRPINNAEMLIRARYDKKIRINTLQYAIMIESSVTSSILNSFMLDYKSKKLPYGDWLPYDYTDTTRFRISYFYEVLSMIAGSYIHVATDALICGLLLQVCCQIEILECRIKSITKGRQSMLHECAWHHDSIYRQVSLGTFDCDQTRVKTVGPLDHRKNNRYPFYYRFFD